MGQGIHAYITNVSTGAVGCCPNRSPGDGLASVTYEVLKGTGSTDEKVQVCCEQGKGYHNASGYPKCCKGSYYGQWAQGTQYEDGICCETNEGGTCGNTCCGAGEFCAIQVPSQGKFKCCPSGQQAYLVNNEYKCCEIFDDKTQDCCLDYYVYRENGVDKCCNGSIYYENGTKKCCDSSYGQMTNSNTICCPSAKVYNDNSSGGSPSYKCCNQQNHSVISFHWGSNSSSLVQQCCKNDRIYTIYNQDMHTNFWSSNILSIINI